MFNTIAALSLSIIEMWVSYIILEKCNLNSCLIPKIGVSYNFQLRVATFKQVNWVKKHMVTLKIKINPISSIQCKHCQNHINPYFSCQGCKKMHIRVPISFLDKEINLPEYPWIIDLCPTNNHMILKCLCLLIPLLYW